ncbi:MAG: LLM class flavin-dependent oxidoreductase [Candidatus Heimdallarchaeota archaeon]|nr:LLM class flavin-dependent oxidoreductase [Candidatus Heimdallarchaeota archaeon]
MKYGIWIPNTGSLDPKLAVEYAVAAEEAGWDGVFVSDVFSEGGFTDPWILLAGIATQTNKIKLGSWVTPLARRQPWQVALDLATLDHLSNGRVIFGAGLGVPEDFTKFGLSSDSKERAAKLDEGLEIINGLWGGSSFSFKGKHYTVNDVILPIVPIQKPRIPILLAGWWPNKLPFKRGAKWDGIMPYWNSLPKELSEEDLREVVDYYKELADLPGEIVVPYYYDLSKGFIDLCQEIDVTWLLSSGLMGKDMNTMEKIREGPPSF